MAGVVASLAVLLVHAACAAPPRAAAPPAVILVLGDGMGSGALDAASYYQADAPGKLFVYRLPRRGTLTTITSPGDQPTDSAAAGTAMACGVFTSNESVGIDRAGRPVQDLVELAHARARAAGIVTTVSVFHATPAVFAAHVDSRAEKSEIALEELRDARPEVLFGGGAAVALPAELSTDALPGSLGEEAVRRGYRLVTDREQLEAAIDDGPKPIAGFFAAGNMPFELDLELGGDAPRLVEMALAAVRILDQYPNGFFLMIESGRIDMSAHANRVEGIVSETLALDRTVRALYDWAESRGNVTLIVTSDHDTGRPRVVRSKGVGEYPEVEWSSGQHTREPVGVFAVGPGTEIFDGATHDLRFIHAVAESVLTGEPFREPAEDPLVPASLQVP